MPTVAQDLQPEHLAAQHYSYESAERLPLHMRPGGPVRMALLLHLAQHPEGVSEVQLRIVALNACSPQQVPPALQDLRVIVGHMASQHLVAVDLQPGVQPLYFSPAARKAARMRRLQGYTLPAFVQLQQVAA